MSPSHPGGYDIKQRDNSSLFKKTLRHSLVSLLCACYVGHVVVGILVAELVSAGLLVGPFHYYCESLGNASLQYDAYFP